MSNKIVRSIFSLSVSQILKYGVNVFISVWIVRYLGVEKFGNFSYILSLTGIISTFSGLGIQAIITKKLIEFKQQRELILGTSMAIVGVAGVIAFLVQNILVVIIHSNDIELIKMSLISSIIFLIEFVKFFTYVYESETKSFVVARLNNISLITSTIAKVVVIYFNLGAYLIVATYSLEVIILGALLVYSYKRDYGITKEFKVNKLLAKSILSDSLPFFFSGLMIGVYMKVDQIMIRNYLGSRESGIFAVAVRLTEIWYFLPLVLQTSFFPKLHESRDNKNEFRKNLDLLYSIMLFFSFVVIISYLIFSKFIVNFLYGQEFDKASEVLRISVFALLFVSIGVARNSYMISKGLNRLYLICTILGAIFNILLNAILLPVIGIMGSAIATVVSYSIAAHFSGLLFKPLRCEYRQINRLFFSLQFIIKLKAFLNGKKN
ncbi:MAG: flippase [Sediminibacterium sp.]|nr:flippase [Sediminibacterium sp.]